MTVDREQIRRAAELNNGWPLAQECLALLAELEQAEQTLDSEHAELADVAHKLTEAEAHLAKVPALVEALRYIEDPRNHHHKPDYKEPASVAREALAAWDSE